MYIYKSQTPEVERKDPEIIVVNFLTDSFPKPYFYLMKRNGNMMDVEPELFLQQDILELSVSH